MKSSQSTIQHMPWVQTRTSKAKYFVGQSVEIDAPIGIVWEIVKDIENYHVYSKGKITAHVEGKPAIDKTISMKLYKNQMIGKLIPTSNERISIVDEMHKIIGWERVLPGGNVTERYQVLEESKEGKTHSHIALKVPGKIGFFTHISLKKWINDAFTEINLGIKEEAEKKSHLTKG
jgi:uncharacterized membrane protein